MTRDGGFKALERAGTVWLPTAVEGWRWGEGLRLRPPRHA